MKSRLPEEDGRGEELWNYEIMKFIQRIAITKAPFSPLFDVVSHHKRKI